MLYYDLSTLSLRGEGGWLRFSFRLIHHRPDPSTAVQTTG